jgi:hypothetical protein
MRMDRNKNEYIRGIAHVVRFGDNARKARLRLFGHVHRRDRDYYVKRMLNLELPGPRARARPKRLFMDG